MQVQILRHGKRVSASKRVIFNSVPLEIKDITMGFFFS